MISPVPAAPPPPIPAAPPSLPPAPAIPACGEHVTSTAAASLQSPSLTVSVIVLRPAMLHVNVALAPEAFAMVPVLALHVNASADGAASVSCAPPTRATVPPTN